MATKAAKAVFTGHGIRVEIVLDSGSQTARLTAIEACRRTAHKFAHLALHPGTKTPTEIAALMSNSSGELLPAIKAGVCTIKVTR